MGGADDHEAAVGGQVIDAVGDGDAVGEGAEVVVVDGMRGSFPSGAVVLEIADQFPLLGVDADDRQAAFGEPQALRRDMLELFVAIRTGAGRDALVIDPQPVAEVLEDAGDGPGTHLDVEGGQLLCDLLGGPARPAATGDGIAGDIVLECRFDGGDHLGRFFSTGWRPPPGRRIRWRWTSPASSCWRPLATVPGSRPSSSATRRSPPWPTLSDSSAA